MEKLSFHYREDPKPFVVMFFVLSLLTFGFATVGASVKICYGEDFAPWTLTAAGVFGLIALYPWYGLLATLEMSVNDVVLSQRVSYFLYAIVASAVVDLIGAFISVDALEVIEEIISLIVFVCGILIAVRCIKAGDAKVKLFGKYFIFVGIILSAVFIAVAAMMLPLLGFHGAGWFTCILFVVLASLSYAYPFHYMRKAMLESSPA